MLLALILGTALAAVAAPVAMGALEGDEEDDDVISDAEHDEARDGDGLLDPERVAHVIDGTSAETVIECFEAGKDRAVLQLDDWGTKLEVRNGDDGSVRVDFAREGGPVGVVFDGFSELPAADIDVSVTNPATGEDTVVCLLDCVSDPSLLLPVAETEAEPVAPLDPDAPDVPPPDLPDAVPVRPADPDAPDAPDDRVAEALDDAAPLAPLDPDSPEDGGVTQSHSLVSPEQDGPPPESRLALRAPDNSIIAAEIDGFDALESIVQIALPMAPDAPLPDVEVAPLADGSGAEVRVDGTVLAILKGAPDAGPENVRLVPRQG